jgi:hypothetical protein
MFMSEGLTSTLAMLIFGASAFIFIMLLPAILELKKPKDAGPRKIMEDADIPRSLTQLAMLERTGGKIELDQTALKKLADIISVLPNLET